MKKLKNYILSINLNPKKEFIEILISIILGIAITLIGVIYPKYINMSVSGLLVPALFIIIKFFHYSRVKDKLITAHEDEFVTVINYLEIFISNNFNVYNAFLQIKTYTSNWMRDRIDTLLADIDQDKSVDPFIKFAKNFKKPIVENVMVAVFQMMEEGESDNQLGQFDILFQRFSENHNVAKIDKKARDIDALATLPLIGAGLVTMILTLGIMAIMGDIISVI